MVVAFPSVALIEEALRMRSRKEPERSVIQATSEASLILQTLWGLDQRNRLLLFARSGEDLGTSPQWGEENGVPPQDSPPQFRAHPARWIDRVSELSQ